MKQFLSITKLQQEECDDAMAAEDAGDMKRFFFMAKLQQEGDDAMAAGDDGDMKKYLSQKKLQQEGEDAMVAEDDGDMKQFLSKLQQEPEEGDDLMAAEDDGDKNSRANYNKSQRKVMMQWQTTKGVPGFRSGI